MWFTSNIYGLDVYFSVPCVQLLLFIVCQPNVGLQQNCLKGDQGNLKCPGELNGLEGTTGSKSGTNVDSADFQKVHKTVLFISLFFFFSSAWRPFMPSSTLSKEVLAVRIERAI